MAGWVPWLTTDDGPIHQRLAAALRLDIEGGKVRPGVRLPTHRELARSLGTSIVTASRAYREAAEQGLVQGAVGRGTFVIAGGVQSSGSPGGRSRTHTPGEGRDAIGTGDVGGYGGLGSPAGPGGLGSPAGPGGYGSPAGPERPPGLGAGGRRAPGGRLGFVDLSANFVAAGAGDLGAAAAGGSAALMLGGLAYRYPPGGGGEHRAAGAAWARRGEWRPVADQVVVTSGAQHAILVTLAALARAGDPLFVEELTYPGVKAAARLLGLRLEAVPIDGEGLVPAALAARCAGGRGGSVFCQPSLHNPTSAVMSLARRREVVALARLHDLTLIEDGAYEFLLPGPLPPLAALAPERTCHITSGAKALLPGMRLGYLVAPEPLVPRLQAEVAASGLVAAPSLLDLATRWLRDGRARRLVEAKRREVARRQDVARTRLAGLDWASHQHSCHLWLTLPPPWQAAPFVEWARRRGVAVNAAPAFVAAPAASAPAAVRICLGAAAEARQLDAALAILADLLGAPPPPEDLVV